MVLAAPNIFGIVSKRQPCGVEFHGYLVTLDSLSGVILSFFSTCWSDIASLELRTRNEIGAGKTKRNDGNALNVTRAVRHHKARGVPVEYVAHSNLLEEEALLSGTNLALDSVVKVRYVRPGQKRRLFP